MSGRYPLATGLAIASVSIAAIVVATSAAITGELGPAFLIAGCIITVGGGVALWTGHTTTSAGASAALAALVVLAGRAADTGAVPFAGLALLTWAVAVLAHLSIVWRAHQVDPEVVRRVALQMCTLGLLAAVVGAAVIQWSGDAPEREVTTETIGVAAIVAAIILAAAFVPRREQPRPPA